jgi:hypothetical protein
MYYDMLLLFELHVNSFNFYVLLIRNIILYAQESEDKFTFR